MRWVSAMMRAALVAIPGLMPAIALASEAGEHHAAPTHVPFSVPFHAVNLAIMIGIIYYFGRTPIRNHLVQRQDSVREALMRAELARKEAEARAAEYEARLAALETEAAEHRQRIEAESKEEAARMIESAHRHAAQIQEQNERLLQDELRSVRERLRRESVDMALNMARQMVSAQITDADQRRLLMDYVGDIKSSEVN